jgi:C1A family cysteine protease
VKYVGGLNSAKNYPYVSYYGTTGDCQTTKTEYVVTVDRYYTLQSEEDMKEHVMSTGPLSICLDASDWSTYQSGVVSECTTEPNHCVQVVGINTEEGYWIVRNSWGTTWGQEGYIYLKYGQNTCAITTDPTYASVVKVA